MPRTPAALREVTQLAFLILVFGWLVTVIKENDMSRASDLERQMLGLIKFKGFEFYISEMDIVIHVVKHR